MGHNNNNNNTLIGLGDETAERLGVFVFVLFFKFILGLNPLTTDAISIHAV